MTGERGFSSIAFVRISTALLPRKGMPYMVKPNLKESIFPMANLQLFQTNIKYLLKLLHEPDLLAALLLV